MNDPLRKATFKLLGGKPEDLQIERLARYLELVATLAGAPDKVRVLSLTGGSVKVALAVSRDHYPALVERVSTAQNPARATAAVTKAVHELREMITDDGMTAEFVAGRTRLMHLRGYERASGEVVGPVLQRWSVRGQVIGLEGKDATKHVRLSEYGTRREVRGDFRSDQLARRLVDHLWQEVVELSGMARMYRHPDGQWELRAFHVDDVKALDPTKPSEILGDLRAALGDEMGRQGAAAPAPR